LAQGAEKTPQNDNPFSVLGNPFSNPVGTGCGKDTATRPQSETQFPTPFFGRENLYQQNAKKNQKNYLFENFSAREFFQTPKINRKHVFTYLNHV
jgi:hypothetical protein